MGYVNSDGANEDGPEGPGRVPAWCWAVLAAVWVGIIACEVRLRAEIAAMQRTLTALEGRRKDEAIKPDAAQSARRGAGPACYFKPVYAGEAPRP